MSSMKDQLVTANSSTETTLICSLIDSGQAPRRFYDHTRFDEDVA
jgi:hypothetical protein